MKIYKILLLGLVLVLFTGCGNIQPEPRVVTVTKEVKVYIPTKMKRPKIECDFKGDGTVPIAKLIECISLQKRVIEATTVE
jgi:hypothetical protein